MTESAWKNLLAIPFLFPVTDGIGAADYIGREACKACHAEQDKAWQGSHHDLAMDEATPDTVLGNFDNAEFEQFGVVSRFYRKDGKFTVNTDGEDGKLRDYLVKYTFGVYPLQQYLVEFPGGRLQALDIAWDSRSKEQGGQRWFHLHPEDRITHEDVLHWTGPNLNWNYMCADCHSTNLRKNLELETGNYHTTWSEIDVSCEACHGPGSLHKQWADKEAAGAEHQISNRGLTVNLDERKGANWLIDEKTGRPVRSTPNESRAEIQVCARCHSRRGQMTDDYTPGEPFMDAYHPSLLGEGLYYPDGQMLDEVYVWGSFRQSKMYQTGVTCSDCHDPHAADLKVPGEQVCYQCHAADRYTSEDHHFHAPGSKGASCVECHMPPTTYMGVDQRHDHGFRVPRPDLSSSMGTPNACNKCHSEQTAEWAAEQVKAWYGKQPQGYQSYAGTLQALRQGRAEATDAAMQLALDASQPSIARATALSHLGDRLGRDGLMLMQQALNDEDPLIRQGALMALDSAPVQQRMIGFPSVWDDVRSVRVQAARLMASYPAEQIPEDRRDKLNQVIQEYIQTQEFNGERPESQLNLGGIYSDLGQFEKAEQAYRKALQLQPRYVPAYVNFAQMLSNRGREIEAANLLQAGLGRNASSADLHHALGLSQVRQKKTDAAIRSLAKAAELDPDNRRYQYVYAVGLQSVGKLEQATEVLHGLHVKQPSDPEILYALVTFNRETGKQQAALEYARKLQSLIPNNPDIGQLVQTLETESTQK